MACRPALRPDLRKFADTASRGPGVELNGGQARHPRMAATTVGA